MSTTLAWFRRDLRLHDHPALDAGGPVVGGFVLDDRLLHGRFASPARTAFMLGCLRELGDGLVARQGRPEEEIPRLAAELGAERVTWTEDVSPFARRRDAAVARALRAAGIEPVPCPGNHIAEVERPYAVFTPFWRAWQQRPRREVLGAAALDRADVRSEPLPGAEAGELAFAPGEAAAREALDRWLAGGIDAYDGEGETSRLSPYLRWGCLSAVECEARAHEHGGPGAEAWVRQLAWRDFFAHVLLHHPDNLRLEHQERYRGMDWERDDEALAAWKEGRTGFPLVDAGMRELAATGWMHNRARMVVGSFLTKDLHLDWREGEAHFERLLLDGEPTQNNGNWQWIASTGVDPQPAFKRIFNPTLQAERFDPDGSYIRRWVPELADLPAAEIHDPPPLERDARGYPQPIVDHLAERRRALERYAATR